MWPLVWACACAAAAGAVGGTVPEAVVTVQVGYSWCNGAALAPLVLGQRYRLRVESTYEVLAARCHKVGRPDMLLVDTFTAVARRPADDDYVYEAHSTATVADYWNYQCTFNTSSCGRGLCSPPSPGIRCRMELRTLTRPNYADMPQIRVDSFDNNHYKLECAGADTTLKLGAPYRLHATIWPQKWADSVTRTTRRASPAAHDNWPHRWIDSVTCRATPLDGEGPPADVVATEFFPDPDAPGFVSVAVSNSRPAAGRWRYECRLATFPYTSSACAFTVRVLAENDTLEEPAGHLALGTERFPAGAGGAEGLYRYYEGQPALLACRRTTPGFTALTLTTSAGATITLKYSNESSVELYAKLTAEHEDALVGCSLLDPLLRQERTVSVRLRMAPDEAPAVTFKVNNLLLAPVGRSGRIQHYEYMFYDQETLALQVARAAAFGDVNCNGRWKYYIHDPELDVNGTKTFCDAGNQAPSEFAAGRSLMVFHELPPPPPAVCCIVRHRADRALDRWISITFPKDPPSSYPVIKLVPAANILYKFVNESVSYIVYDYAGDETLDLFCYWSLTFNPEEVIEAKNDYGRQTIRLRAAASRASLACADSSARRPAVTRLLLLRRGADPAGALHAATTG